MSSRIGAQVVVLVLVGLLSGCQKDTAQASQKKIRSEQLPELVHLVHEDIQRQQAGMRDAAKRLAPGFQVADPAEREKEMRTALKYVQQPPKGINQFVTSPMSFLAAVDAQGVVICRDMQPDRMKGMDMKKKFPVVRAALEQGKTGYALGEFFGKGKEPSSWSIVFANPVESEGQRVGVVVSGIPLWRLAQQLSRQMRVEHVKGIEKGLVLWAYVLKGDRSFHMGTPPELDSALPPASEIRKKLGSKAGVMTGYVNMYGRTYGYGARPLLEVGPDVVLLVVRAEAPS